MHKRIDTIAIASGKGGTGKTMVATNLAAVMQDVCLIDCDVEEPNCHLFVKPDIHKVQKVCSEVPVIDSEKCTACGKCVEACRFKAIAKAGERLVLFPELCHSCSVCHTVCPENALVPTFHELGEVRSGSFGENKQFVKGVLKIGQVRSAEVIRKATQALTFKTVVRDCPPGTSCAMVAAVDGASIAVLVTEPTAFGLHDLQAAVDTLEWLGVPHCAVINKCDLGTPGTEDFCREKGIPIIGRIPFTEEIAAVVSAGRLLAEENQKFHSMFEEMLEQIMAGEARTAPRRRHIEPATAVDAFDLYGRCKDSKHNRSISNLAIVSGKGGTGKTTLAASFAALMENKVVADCDVDAANLHLLLDSHRKEFAFFRSSYIAEIDPAKCSGCGICARKCEFDAIRMTPKAEVDPLKCEGCGLCEIVCPLSGFEGEKPVSIRENIDGEAYVSDSRHGTFAHARLYPGGEASGKLVTLLRTMAEGLAGEENSSSILIDGSPGVGCPVNASIVNADMAVVVAEPSMSSIHDLKRVLNLIDFFGVPARVVINRADLNREIAADIVETCEKANVPILGSIPFDRLVVDAMANGLPPVLDDRCISGDAIREIFDRVNEELKGMYNAKR